MAITTFTQRLLDKFTIGDGCWEWTASKNGGYGQINAGGPMLRAHRIIYELLEAPIPEGLTIDHLCKNRGCVNPQHMEIVTRGENARRGGGLEVANERRRARTHCKRGHEFTPENTYHMSLTSGSVARSCRKCHALRERERKASH